MARVPVILLTRVTSPNALATALRRRGFTVTCTSDPAVADNTPEPVVVGPDWKPTAPPADRAVPWIFLPLGAPLTAQVELVQAVLQAEPTDPSSVHATEAPATEQLAQPSVLTATVPPGADPLDTLELTPVSMSSTAATGLGMGEEDTTEAVVQPRSHESHTLDLLDPNDTLDGLAIAEGHETTDLETIAPQATLAPWGLDPEAEPSRETLALPLVDRPLENSRQRTGPRRRIPARRAALRRRRRRHHRPG